MQSRDRYSSKKDPYAAAERARSEDSYTYSGEDEPGSAWGNGTLARAGATDLALDPYGYRQDQFYQPQRYDPYRSYDPYSQPLPPSGKGGYPSSSSGYPPQPSYPPQPGYPPPPSGYAGSRDQRDDRYSHYAYFGQHGYAAPPGYPGYPPPGYPPPPPGYPGYPPGYGHDSNRFSNDRGKGRSRSPRRFNNKGRKRGGGGGGNRPGDRGEQNNQGGGGKNRRKKRDDDMDEREEDRVKPNLELPKVLEEIEKSAKDQTASRYLQMTLDEGNEEDLHAIFEAVLPFLSKLAGDQFGNFVVQKLLEKGNDLQREGIVQEIKNDIGKISLDKHGCRVIQKAIELLKTKPEQQLVVAHDLKSDVLGCIKSMHGNHVIQKCVEFMQSEHLLFIIEAVETHIEFIAGHMYGCRVVQRLLERHRREQGDESNRLGRLLDTLMKSVRKLMTDQHGNYVVQCVLKEGRLEDKKEIIQAVRDKVVDYAKNKCSSNVVERCLEISTEGENSKELVQDREALMNALMGTSSSNSPLKELMADKFGNFIVSKMVKYSGGKDKEMLKSQLEMEEDFLRSNPSGKHILTTMQKEWGSRLD